MNENFFEQIDTEEKAYWLGFIATDGCVIGDRKTAMALGPDDRGHLVKLLHSVGSDNVIYHYLSKNDKGEYYSIRLTSQKMVSDLNNLGIHNRKTFTVKPWNGPKELMRHYWRGCVDGDGWVCVRTNKGKYNYRIRGIGFCGNLAMVEGFKEFVKQETGIDVAITPDKSIFKVYIGGIRNPKTVARLLYGNCNIALQRKLDLAKEVMDTEPKTLRHDLGRQELLDLFKMQGKWTEVAKTLKVSPSYLRSIRRRLNISMDARWSK